MEGSGALGGGHGLAVEAPLAGVLGQKVAIHVRRGLRAGGHSCRASRVCVCVVRKKSRVEGTKADDTAAGSRVDVWTTWWTSKALSTAAVWARRPAFPRQGFIKSRRSAVNARTRASFPHLYNEKYLGI